MLTSRCQPQESSDRPKVTQLATLAPDLIDLPGERN